MWLKKTSNGGRSEKIEQELENLKTVRRKEIAEKIKVALSFGDLSENSEYDEAKMSRQLSKPRLPNWKQC